MKLKRCPNLHYYDGDKYDVCPHCAKVKTPETPPKPVMEPVPQPEKPKADSVPEIQAEKSVEKTSAAFKSENTDNKTEEIIAKKSDEKDVEKQAVSKLILDKEEAWRCKCGAVNQGKFCFECGSPKPLPEPPKPAGKPVDAIWICRCGAENKGKFCFQCGSPRPDNKKMDEVALPSDDSEQPKATEPESVPEPEKVTPAAPETDRSLTAQIEDISFTGHMDDAIAKVSASMDEGVTQVIFDDIDDGFVLAWLTVTNTSSKGKVFTLTQPKNTMGRADMEHPVDIDIHNDRGISRGVQATIVYDPLNKKFFLQSAGGRTYIYINKEMVLTYKKLTPYDIIRIGETDLVFVPLCSEHFSW